MKHRRAPSWVALGTLGWVVATAVYITATGFRRMAAGYAFYSSPTQAGVHLVMMGIGAVLSPFLFVIFRRVRAGSPGAGALVLRYALIGAAYLAAWAGGLVVAGELGLLPGVPRADPFAFWLQALVMMAFIALGLYAVMVMMFEAVRYLHEARARRVEAARLQAELAEAHTTELRARLNPGLVYESFDVASRLMDEDVKTARTVLADLSELLRVSLGRNGDPEIMLRDEMELLRRYIDIQRHRFLGGVLMEIDIPEELARSRVPALILQPIVESLLSDRRSGHPLVLRITASCASADLCLEVVRQLDHDGGRDGSPDPEGITRCRARLELIYGGDADLQVTRQNSGPVVSVRLPQQDGSVCHE